MPRAPQRRSQRPWRARDLPRLRAMTPKRLTIAAGAVAVLALLVVGLVQLAGSSTSPTRPSKLTLAQMRARLAGSPAPLAQLHAQAGELLPGRTDGAARASGLAARPAGGDQQVGVVVRALPRGVRRLSGRVRWRWDARWRSSGSTPATPAAPRATSFLRSFPVSYPELLRPQRRGRRGAHRLDVHAGDGLLRPLGRAVHPPGAVPEPGAPGSGRQALRARRAAHA